jgi:hypothetical protein
LALIRWYAIKPEKDREMAFRQNMNQAHKQFLKASQQELLELGVPVRTLDYDAWTYLLNMDTVFIQVDQSTI